MSNSRTADVTAYTTDIVRCCWFWCCFLRCSFSLCSSFIGFSFQLCLSYLKLQTAHRPPFVMISSMCLPVACWQTSGKHVSLTDILEVQRRFANRPPPRFQLTGQQDLGDSPVFHLVHMAKPPQSALFVEGKYWGDNSSFKYLIVWDLICPQDGKDAMKTSHMEGVQAPLLPSISCPRLAAVK